MKFKVALILVFLLQGVVSVAQEGWGNYHIFNEELKGMMFNAELDYKPDCDYATPFVRATLHSIEVTRFTYNGRQYDGEDIEGVEFPIKVEGYISTSVDIQLISTEYTRWYTMGKKHLSTKIGGSGSAFTADEFRFEDEDQKDMLETFNWSSCVDLNASATYNSLRITGIEIFEGDLRYKDQSLNLYLANLIKKQESNALKFEQVMQETEKFEDEGFTVNEYENAIEKLESIKGFVKADDLKDVDDRIDIIGDNIKYAKEDAIIKKYEHLRPYQVYSNSNDMGFYLTGANKTKELISKASDNDEKEYLEQVLNQIQNCYNKAEEVFETKEQLAAELKRDSIRRKKEATRLDEEEIKRMNAQRMYLNKVGEYEAKGFDTNTAHKLAQNDFKIQQMDELGTAISNAVAQIGTDIIYAYFDKKERLYAENWAKFNAYRRAFNKRDSLIRVANIEKNRKIADLPMSKEMSKDIEGLKQEILWYIKYEANKYHTIHHEYPSGWGSVVSYGRVIAKTEVNDAYFQGDKLYVTTTTKCLDASYDLDNLERNNIKKESPEPTKYTLIKKAEYDYITGESLVTYQIYWHGMGYYPSAGSFATSENFWNYAKTLAADDYVRPANYGLNRRSSVRLAKMREIYKRDAVNKLVADPSFISRAEQALRNDLDGFYEPFSGGPSIILDYKLTSNPNERVLIRFWDGKYIMLSYPGKDVFDKQYRGNFKYDAAPKYSSSSYASASNFYSTIYNNAFIGGNGNMSIALKESKGNSLTQKVCFYNDKNRLVKALDFPEELNEDIWMPIVEIGTYTLYTEQEYIKDPELKEKMTKWKVQDRRLINYREEPSGLLINLRPENQMLLAQYYLNTYGYAGKERVVIATNGGSKEKMHLYNATSIQHLVGRKVYKSDYKNVNASDIKRIDALNVNTSITYSRTFLNSFYESFDESNEGDLLYNELTNKKAHGSWYYFMFNSIDLVDLSENGIKYQGRIPTFYSNGKLESVGLTENGKKIGKWEYYDETGAKTQEEKYVIGNVLEYKILYDKSGVAVNRKSYWTNGLINYEYRYNTANGVRTTISYYDGIIIEELDWRADDLFDENGKLLESRDYEDGILVKTTKY